jgi:hypothetical protein
VEGRTVNRWRQRLAELHGEIRTERAPTTTGAVQNVQSVQKQRTAPPFGHFEQIEQPGTARVLTPSATDPTFERWGEVQEQRAAIVECHGKIPRVWAEGFARLNPDRSVADVPLHRWQRFVDDVGLFLDSPFCAVAGGLGWGPYDLFGCDRDRPFARIDQAGLLWLLNGDKLIALSENAAGIETRSGERHTYRRKPNEPGRVLAWELAL